MKNKIEDIKVDYSRDVLFDKHGITRLKDSYMREDEESPQERFAYVAAQFGSNPGHAQRLYDYISKHWLSPSTPIASFGRNKNSLAISCFLNSIPDTAEGLVDTLSETNTMSMRGGGVGIYFGIRSADEKSTGIMPHLKIYDASSMAYKQGKTRRGSYAAYVDISHPDILNFIELRKPTGDPNLRCLNLHHAVNITDDFMAIIEKCMYDENFDDSWELKDPGSDKVKEVVSAKELWEKLLETRLQTGEPYLHFVDRSNEKLPAWIKEKGYRVNHSNLCVTGDTEIYIRNATSGELSKVNMAKFVSMWEKDNDNWEVLSYNEKNDDTEWKPVTAAALMFEEAQVIEIECDESGHKIKCTPEHKIYTKNRGYVQAKDLKETDELVIA